MSFEDSGIMGLERKRGELRRVIEFLSNRFAMNSDERERLSALCIGALERQLFLQGSFLTPQDNSPWMSKDEGGELERVVEFLSTRFNLNEEEQRQLVEVCATAFVREADEGNWPELLRQAQGDAQPRLEQPDDADELDVDDEDVEDEDELDFVGEPGEGEDE